MSGEKVEDSVAGDRTATPQARAQEVSHRSMSDEEAQQALDQEDNQKIDRVLDDEDVSTDAAGEDQTSKPDTEGSNSSSKNLDEQDDADPRE
jgi:hypothetical protein